tara:strand:- start:118 stop:510 length:393 start_codon:yes stop_codon:yes gene_type:complete
MILLLLSLAAYGDPEFANLKKGERAPFEGRLFNEEAIASILTNNSQKDMECQLEIEYQLDKQSTKKQYEYELLKASCKAENEMLKEVARIRLNEIESIRGSYKPARPYIWLTSGFVLGSAASIGIFHAVK